MSLRGLGTHPVHHKNGLHCDPGRYLRRCARHKIRCRCAGRLSHVTYETRLQEHHETSQQRTCPNGHKYVRPLAARPTRLCSLPQRGDPRGIGQHPTELLWTCSDTGAAPGAKSHCCSRPLPLPAHGECHLSPSQRMAVCSCTVRSLQRIRATAMTCFGGNGRRAPEVGFRCRGGVAGCLLQ